MISSATKINLIAHGAPGTSQMHCLAPPTLAASVIQSEIMPQYLPPPVWFLVLMAVAGLATGATQPALTYAASGKAAKVGLQEGENNLCGQTRSRS